jgi:hypothetical protein
LVKLQGPQGFRSGAAWAAFQGVRPAIVFSAIHRRQATFISSEEWCSIPWQLHAKPPWQKAMDIMAQVPELLENFDKLSRITSCDNCQVRKMQLLNHCGILDRALQAWYQDLPSSFALETADDLWYTKSKLSCRFTVPNRIAFQRPDPCASIGIVLGHLCLCIQHNAESPPSSRLNDCLASQACATGKARRPFDAYGSISLCRSHRAVNPLLPGA